MDPTIPNTPSTNSSSKIPVQVQKIPIMAGVGAGIGLANLSLILLTGLLNAYLGQFFVGPLVVIRFLPILMLVSFPVGFILAIIGAISGFRSYAVHNNSKALTLAILCVLSAIATLALILFTVAFVFAVASFTF